MDQKQKNTKISLIKTINSIKKKYTDLHNDRTAQELQNKETLKPITNILHKLFDKPPLSNRKNNERIFRETESTIPRDFESDNLDDDTLENLNDTVPQTPTSIKRKNDRNQKEILSKIKKKSKPDSKGKYKISKKLVRTHRLRETGNRPQQFIPLTIHDDLALEDVIAENDHNNDRDELNNALELIPQISNDQIVNECSPTIIRKKSNPFVHKIKKKAIYRSNPHPSKNLLLLKKKTEQVGQNQPSTSIQKNDEDIQEKESKNIKRKIGCNGTASRRSVRIASTESNPDNSHSKVNYNNCNTDNDDYDDDDNAYDADEFDSSNDDEYTNDGENTDDDDDEDDECTYDYYISPGKTKKDTMKIRRLLSYRKVKDKGKRLHNNGDGESKKKKKIKSGRGMADLKLFDKNKNATYIYWDDPNELVDRLRLLLSSKLSGHSGHNNEILSITEELKEANIIE